MGGTAGSALGFWRVLSGLVGVERVLEQLVGRGTQFLVTGEADVNKVFGVVREAVGQRGHGPSLGSDVEQGSHLVHVSQRGFPGGHLEHGAPHTPDVGLPAVP